MPRPELPPLPTGPLTLAAARDLGLRDSEWRATGPRRTQSVRSTVEPESTGERARLFALALPEDCAFSHVTAARLWGLPLPRTVEDQEELDVIRSSGRGRVERRGCVGHRGADRRALVTLHGLRLTGLADTWVDLGEVVARGLDLDDLVIAADEVLTQGVFPDSPGQTPRRTSGGCWPRAEGDLVWRHQRVIGEYQGAVHGGIREGSYDADRNGLLCDEGWRLLEIYSDDVFRAPRRRETLRRFAVALALDPRALRIE